MHRIHIDWWKAMRIPTPCVCCEPVSFYHVLFKCKNCIEHAKPLTDKNEWLAWDSPCASKDWQCVTSERAFSVPPPNWSTAVRPTWRMRYTPWRPYCGRPPLQRDQPASVPWGRRRWRVTSTDNTETRAVSWFPTDRDHRYGGSAMFRSLNTANPQPCLPSVTNAPSRQVSHSPFLKTSKTRKVFNPCRITVWLT